MKNVNVEVSLTGEVVVTSMTGRVIPNVNVTGLREFAAAMMEAGVKKQYESIKATEPAKEPKQESITPNKEEKDMKKIVNRKGYDAVVTGGKMFNNIKGIKSGDVLRAVQFTNAKGQEVVIGFARDKNAFMQSVDRKVEDASLSEVLRRLAKYEGKDAKFLTKMVKNLRPVTTAADVCSECKCEVTHRVKEYSVRNYGVTLCRNCQKDFGDKLKEVAPKESTSANKQAPSDSEAQNLTGISGKKDTCTCGNEKIVEVNMCQACADSAYEAELEEAMLFMDGQSSEEKAERSEAEQTEQTLTEYVNPVNVEFDASELV